MPSVLSGGRKKRVGIARARVNNSKYLFEHTRVLRYTKDLYEQLKNIDNLRFTGHPSNRLFSNLYLSIKIDESIELPGKKK